MFRIIIDYVGISVLMGVAFAAVEYFFATNMPNGTVVTVIAAMVAGQLYGGRTGHEVTSAFAWKVGLVLTLVSLLVAALIFGSAHLLGESLIPDDISMGVLFVILLVALAVSVLIIRFTFRWAVKQGAKNSPNRADPEIFE